MPAAHAHVKPAEVLTGEYGLSHPQVLADSLRTKVAEQFKQILS